MDTDEVSRQVYKRQRVEKEGGEGTKEGKSKGKTEGEKEGKIENRNKTVHTPSL